MHDAYHTGHEQVLNNMRSIWELEMPSADLPLPVPVLQPAGAASLDGVMSAGIIPGPGHVVEADCQTETIGLITRHISDPDDPDLYGTDIHDFIWVMESDVDSLPGESPGCTDEMEKFDRRLTDILSTPHILHLPITRAHLTQMRDYTRLRREELLGETELNPAPGVSGTSVAEDDPPGIVRMMFSCHACEYTCV
jgi:hypothetical protein